MKSRISRWFVQAVIVMVMLAPSVVLARRDEPERDLLDARYEGYAQVTTLESNSTSMTYIMLGFLGVVGTAGLFKNARRSHLD